MLRMCTANIPFQSDATRHSSSSFLGTLLKNSLYSATSVGKYETAHFEGVASQSTTQDMTGIPRKENYKFLLHVKGHQSAIRQDSAAQTQARNQDTGFGKSRSSVAPTTTHAHAQMHTQPSRPGGPFQSLEWEIRHHPPSPSRSLQSAYSTAMVSPHLQRGIPQYDGSTHEPLLQDKSASNEPEATRKNAEQSTLNPKVFQTDKSEPPAGHAYDVENFLERLKQAEARDMAKYPPRSPKES